MWGILIGSAVFLVTVIMSLFKASSKREQIAEQHREELLKRNKKEE